MRMSGLAKFQNGTDPSLIELAKWRGRFEVGRALSRGEAPELARDSIIRRFREELMSESFGTYADEVLMAAVQRGVEAALVGGSSRGAEVSWLP